MTSLAALEALGPQAAAAQLIMPALDLRKNPAASFAEALAQMSARPWYGFLIFGGDVQRLPSMTRSLRRIASVKDFPRPLMSCDVERGLGQIVAGGQLLPSLEAVGMAGSEALAEELGLAIARESLNMGIDAPFVPVLDLSDLDANPIVGARSFGSKPDLVARLGAAFVRGVESTGALACGKHFPGHGGTLQDSHDSLPRVSASADHLKARDLSPFKAAIDAGLSSIMTAHVAYDAYSALPATLEPAILKAVLREELGFQGLAITDAFIMSGLLDACGGDEAKAAIAAIDAGCDVILYPNHPEAIADAIAAAITERGWDWVRPALTRILARKARLPEITAPTAEDRHEAAQRASRLAAALARRPDPQAIKALREAPNWQVLVLDDDGGTDAALDFICGLSERGPSFELSSYKPEDKADRIKKVLSTTQPRVLVIRCSIKAWKGRPGLHPQLSEALDKILEAARAQSQPALIVALTGSQVIARWPEVPTIQVFGEGPACEQCALDILLG